MGHLPYNVKVQGRILLLLSLLTLTMTLPGCLANKRNAVLAKVPVGQWPNDDETEFIEVRPFPFTEVISMVLAGEIVDSMTIITVLHAARLKGGALD